MISSTRPDPKAPEALLMLGLVVALYRRAECKFQKLAPVQDMCSHGNSGMRDRGTILTLSQRVPPCQVARPYSCAVVDYLLPGSMPPIIPSISNDPRESSYIGRYAMLSFEVGG